MTDADGTISATLNPIDDLENVRSKAWKVFFRVEARLHAVLEERLKRQLGISVVDYHVLLTLWDAPGRSMRMGQLAEELAFSASRVSYLVTNLENDGLLRRESHVGDRRGSDATLTDRGEEVVLQASRIHQELVRELAFIGKDEHEVEAATTFFASLEGRLSEFSA